MVKFYIFDENKVNSVALNSGKGIPCIFDENTSDFQWEDYLLRMGGEGVIVRLAEEASMEEMLMFMAKCGSMGWQFVPEYNLADWLHKGGFVSVDKKFRLMGCSAHMASYFYDLERKYRRLADIASIVDDWENSDI